MKPLHFAVIGLLVGSALVALTPAQAQPSAGPKMATKDAGGPGGGEAYDCDPRLKWRITVVDGADADVGEYNSLAIPTVGPYSGRPGISYWDRTNGDLKYAQWNGSQWQVGEPVDSVGDVGRLTSLAFSPDEGLPYISYVSYYGVDLTPHWLKVACLPDWEMDWQTAVWYTELNHGYAAHSSSLKFRLGTPVVAVRGHYPGIPHDAGLLYFEEPLVPTPIEGGKYAGYRCSMAIDPADSNERPAIAYTGPDWGVLKYASSEDAADWDIDNVVYEDDAGWFCSLAFFPPAHPVFPGQPAIAYHDGNTDSLNFAWRDGDDWNHCIVVRAVERGAVLGRYPSLAILPNGHPAISFAKDRLSGPAELRYAYHNANNFNFCEGWNWDTVDDEGQVGSHTSLAILPTRLPVISYYDTTNGDLKCAFRRASVDVEVDER